MTQQEREKQVAKQFSDCCMKRYLNTDKMWNDFTESPKYKAIPAAESDRDEILECLYDVFYQSCMHADGKFDNQLLSAYESAQDLLIRLGKIKESDCYRK